MIDLEHQILPNVITLPGIAVGLALQPRRAARPVASLLGIVLGAGVLYAIAAGYYLLRKEEGMGMGDVKMLAMIGAFLGWRAVLLTLVLSSFAGALVGVAADGRQPRQHALRAAVRHVSRARRLVVDAGGDAILAWYLGFYRDGRSDPPRRLPPSPHVMNPTGYAFLGLTGIVAVLVALLAFAVLRFAAAARDAGARSATRASRPALLASALEEAITKLKAQERATAARAEASERLSAQIVASLTSGLVVVDSAGRVKIVNPAARRILGSTTQPAPLDELLRAVPALREVIDESLRTQYADAAPHADARTSDGPMHLGVSVSPLAAEPAPTARSACSPI